MKIDFMLSVASLLGLVLVLATADARAVAEWETDIELALERAQQEKRDVILVFRGPSSNPICKQMNENVLDGLEFRTVIGIEYVLCHALSPEDRPDDDRSREQYLALSKRFHMTSYPIFFLIDSGGYVYGRAAIPKSTAAELIRTIAELRPRKAIVAELVKAADLAKPGDAEQIKALSDALGRLGAEFAMTQYPELVARVMELDSSNEYGLRVFWEQQQTARDLAKFNQIYASIAPVLWSKKTSAEMIELLDSTIKKHSMQGELLQMMEVQKYRAWGKEKNFQMMLETARAALAIAPESTLAPRLQGMVKRSEELLESQGANSGAGEEKQGAPATPPSDGGGSPTPTPDSEIAPEPLPIESPAPTPVRPSEPGANAAAGRD